MINLEQIQKLESRVNKAVELIRTLKAENQNLRKALDSTQARLQELEKLVGDFKSDQKEIEHCILRALQNLDELEDEIEEAKIGGSAARQVKSAKAEARSGAVKAAVSGEGKSGDQDGEAPSSQLQAESAEEPGEDRSQELDIF